MKKAKHRAGLAAISLAGTTAYLNNPAQPDADGDGIEDSHDPYPNPDLSDAATPSVAPSSSSSVVPNFTPPSAPDNDSDGISDSVDQDPFQNDDADPDGDGRSNSWDNDDSGVNDFDNDNEPNAFDDYETDPDY